MSDQLKKIRDEWRKNYAAELLTQQQVNGLPDGAEVEIIWCGGNGPHQYFSRRQKGSPNPLAWTHQPVAIPVADITCVGSDRYHTQVRLVSLPSERPAPEKPERE